MPLLNPLENTIEKCIKEYRDITAHHACQRSMQENNSDCLRAMWLQSRQDIREYEKHQKSKHDENDVITKTIHDFFVVLEDGKKWSFDAVNHAMNVFGSAFTK